MVRHIFLFYNFCNLSNLFSVMPAASLVNLVTAVCTLKPKKANKTISILQVIFNGMSSGLLYFLSLCESDLRLAFLMNLVY